MRPPVLALALSASLLGCGRERVSDVNPDLSVSATALDFGAWSVGSSRTLPLIITNRSRISEAPSLRVDGPFSASAPGALGGGQDLVLPVTFAPPEPGPLTGRLVVDGLEVALRGVGLRPDVCVSSGCVGQTLDPATGHCVASPVADGTACGAPDTCVVNGLCRQGVCLGEPPNCDDHDLCTRDACAPGVGCVHTDVGAACPAPSDPCRAASCDPVTGCGSAAVPDGTPCGEVSCVLASVCMQGACRQLTPPDGFTCAPASPCRGEGHCHGQQCVQPALSAIEPAWRYGGGANTAVVFQGVADEQQGSLYWLECQAGGAAGLSACEAVSFTGAGLPRFRTPLPGRFPVPWGERTQLFDAGRLIVALGDTVFAVDGVGGRLLWVSSLATVGGGAVTVDWLATSPDGGQLWAVLRRAAGGTVGGLVRLDAATGAVRGGLSPSPPGSWSGVVVDAAGNGWSTLLAAPGVELQSVTPAGALRLSVPLLPWSVPVGVPPLPPTVRPVSTAGDQVVNDDDRVFDTASGALLHARTTPSQLRYLESLQLPGARYRVARDDQAAVTTLEVDGGTTVATLRQTHAGPFATRDGSLLFAAGSWGGFDLALLSPAGQPRFSCSADSGSQTVAGAAAFTGRYLALATECAVCFRSEWELQVYDVGALGSAPSGWVAPGGTVGAAGHPR